MDFDNVSDVVSTVPESIETPLALAPEDLIGRFARFEQTLRCKSTALMEATNRQAPLPLYFGSDSIRQAKDSGDRRSQFLNRNAVAERRPGSQRGLIGSRCVRPSLVGLTLSSRR